MFLFPNCSALQFWGKPNFLCILWQLFQKFILCTYTKCLGFLATIRPCSDLANFKARFTCRNVCRSQGNPFSLMGHPMHICHPKEAQLWQNYTMVGVPWRIMAPKCTLCILPRIGITGRIVAILPMISNRFSERGLIYTCNVSGQCKKKLKNVNKTFTDMLCPNIAYLFL